MNRNEEKLNEWRALLNERKEKGLTIKEFCKGKNVTPAQFYYYQEIIKEPIKPKEKIQVKGIDKTTLKPVQIINSPSKEEGIIRFILPNSVHCIFPRDMKVTEIKAILEIVLSC